MEKIAADLVRAFLHDPPDKALGIQGHVTRARKLTELALGIPVGRDEVHDPADPIAAISERLPAPRWDVLTVPYRADAQAVKHPLSSASHPQTASPPGTDVDGYVAEQVQRLLDGVGPMRSRFLLLWRLLPETLADNQHPWFAFLPADTRVPDHTIWHHLDTTAGLKAAEADSALGAAFLSFSLGPVQSFISAARTVRDLWSGSMVLSWLTFQAMAPVLEALGPTAFVYPALRGLPWLDLWLRQQEDLNSKIEAPDAAQLCTPCLPNRFLALVPWGADGTLAADLAAQCREAGRSAWRTIATSVHGTLADKFRAADRNWDHRWRVQIEDFFDFRTAVLPWRETTQDHVIGELLGGRGGFAAAFPHAHQVRVLADIMPEAECPGYDQRGAGRWQARVELSARLMQALRSIRHVPASLSPDFAQEQFPPKCSLLGSHEQMGPAGLEDSSNFWQQVQQATSVQGVRLRERERLCAVAMVKRFAGPAYFASRLGLTQRELRYDDTASVAAADWLRECGLDPEQLRRKHGSWSGQWLHWPKPDFDRDDVCPTALWQLLRDARAKSPRPAPAYYACLMIDGDRMGQWLSGEKSPPLRDVYHADLVEYFKTKVTGNELLDARRPVGPALHAAISEALTNFSLHFVPHIVASASGTLIYAGGDDVLALLPSDRAIACALQLRQTFQRDWAADPKDSRARMLMGSQATISAGIALVHYKEDLRFALDAARQAEKAAKNMGRDALQIMACRRSGEHALAFCPWEMAADVLEWVGSFRKKASDRWAYHLRAELPTLGGLPVESMSAEIRRQLQRSESATQKMFSPEQMAAQFERYRQLILAEHRTMPSERAARNGLVLEQFVTLCQTASFMARGRDA